jgi:hypothetical protein
MKVKKFQQGGPAPEQAAPQQAGPEEQIAQMAQEIIGQLGPEASAMLAQMIMQMLEGAAQEQAPQQPTYQRKGGALVRKTGR